MNDREFRQLVTAMRIAQRRYRDLRQRGIRGEAFKNQDEETRRRLRDEATRLTREVDAVIGLLPFEGRKNSNSIG